MRRLLNAFLIITLLTTLHIGHSTIKYQENDILDENQVLGLDYVGYDTDHTNKNAVSASQAPLYGEKEGIKTKIQQIAQGTGVDWRILYVLAKYESSLNPDASRINAYEESYGLYQINTKVHNVSPQQAKDIEFATKWTIDYLLQNGYTNEYVIVPLAKHQGSPEIPKVINRANKIYYEAQEI